MKDVIVSARYPLSQEEWDELRASHEKFVESYYQAVPPTHPDRLAKEAMQLYDLGAGRIEGSALGRRDLQEALTHFFLPLEIPKFWLPFSELAPHLEGVHRRISILDLGAGVGTAGISALLFFARRSGIREAQLVSVDHDRMLGTLAAPILDVARRVCGIQIQETRHVSTVEEYLSKAPSERFDIVIASNLLGEAFPVASPTEATVELFSRLLREKVKKTGFLVVTEPSIKRSSRMLSKALEELQAKGMPTFSPCATGGRCPYLETKEKFCIHSVPVSSGPLVQSVAARANLRSHEVHFSYGVLSPQGLRMALWPETPAEGHFPARVVSFSDRRPHGFAYQLCTSEGSARGIAQRQLPDGSVKGNRILHGTSVLVAKEWFPNS